MVGHYPTIKLIGREHIPYRKNFPPHNMRHEVISGINFGFPKLSRSTRQITHVLLTRAPLYSDRSPFAIDLHVLGAPPTFALSQDQTLQLAHIRNI